MDSNLIWCLVVGGMACGGNLKATKSGVKKDGGAIDLFLKWLSIMYLYQSMSFIR